MKTLYSSAFLSVILGFFALSQSTGQTLVRMEADQAHRFYNIYADQDIREEDQTLAIEVFERFDSVESQRYIKETLPKLRDLYEKDDQVFFTVYNVSDSENMNEVELAKALRCATEQDRFWDVHDMLYFHDIDHTLNRLDEIIASMELDLDQFNRCFESEETLAMLEKDREKAKKRKITIYPTTLINNQRLIHHQPWENVERIIRQF